MRTGGWLAAAVVAMSAVLVLSAPEHAQAACPRPTLSVRPTSGTSGATVVLSGNAFYSACPSGGVIGTTPPTPERGIRLQFVQGGDTVPLGLVDADSQGKFSREAIVPLSATAGSAAFRAAGASATADASFEVLLMATTSTSSRSTTTTSSRSTTPTSSSSTTSTTEQTFPTIEPASTTAPTIKVHTGGTQCRDWTGWIVLGIVGIGLSIFGVSWRILRAQPPSPPLPPD